MTTDTDTKIAELEAVKAHNKRASYSLRQFIRTMTQGDWIAVSRALDMDRATIADDENLVMLATAYVKDKRDHGGADWGKLLDLTNDQLLERHGYRIVPDDDPDPDAVDTATGDVDQGEAEHSPDQ